MVEVTFRVFFPRRKPSFMRELYCDYVLSQLLYYERGYFEMNKWNSQQVCCRLHPFVLLDNNKEGPDNFSGGCSPN
jgi:hypothetical protein